MRVAFVNNGTKEPEKLFQLLRNHEVVSFGPNKSLEIFEDDFDLIVLSGSSRFPITKNEWLLLPEIDLIKNSKLPIIGICYGCELIVRAFGGSLVDHGDESKERDLVKVKVENDDPVFKGRKEFEAYDAHRWVVASLPEQFKVLARSVHGPEIIRHTERPLWCFQFHPEKMIDQSYGDEIFSALLKTLVQK